MHKKKTVFLINKSEITAGSRGASLGPEAIITAARKKESTIFGTHEVQKIENANHLLDLPTQYQFAKRIDGLLSIYKVINEKVASLLNSGSFPLLLAADHGSAGGTIAGIKTFTSSIVGDITGNAATATKLAEIKTLETKG